MLKCLAILALLGITLAENVENVNQNYADKINSKIVQQITMEMGASYLYQAYGHYFARADVALPGFAKWFEKASKEERDHATGLLEYVNKRGGSLSFNDINFNELCRKTSDELSKFPKFGRDTACICYFMSHKKDKALNSCGDRDGWKNGLWAMQDTLVLERIVNQHLLNLHKDASDETDPHLTHVLEHAYLEEQVEAIKSVGDYVRQLERVGDGLGEYMFDKDL